MNGDFYTHEGVPVLPWYKEEHVIRSIFMFLITKWEGNASCESICRPQTSIGAGPI